MPLAAEHTARQIAPGDCDRIRTGATEKGITMLWCVRAGKTAVQSVHLDASKFTAEEARAWLQAHDFSTANFVAATKEPATAEAEAAACDIRCGAGSLELLAELAGRPGPRRVALEAYTGVPMKLDNF